MELTDTIIDGFRAAAIGMAQWDAPLNQLARAVDAHAGQLGGFDRHGALVLNVMSNVSDEEIAAYHRHGGADPVANVRNHAIIRARPLRCLTEEDFATPDLVARAPIYRDLFVPYDVQHACMMRLNADDEPPTAVALLRSRSRGHAGSDERRLLEAVAPALAGAVRTARHLARGTEAAILATAEALSGPTILLGPGLKIVSMSPAAEALLQAGTHLSIRGGCLWGPPATTALLDTALAAVTAPGAAARQDIACVLHAADGSPPLLADMSPMPRRCIGPMAQARAMLTISRPRPAPRSPDTLIAAFALTRAEADVATLLADGRDIADIAAQRGSAVSTVRNQVKTLMAKTDTRRQAELILKIRRY